MFQRLLSQARDERRMAHPALSFALHAGVIAALVVAGRPALQPAPDVQLDSNVIWVPDAPRTPEQVATDPPVAPGPVCSCPVVAPVLEFDPGTLPGRLDLPLPGQLIRPGDSFPGIDMRPARPDGGIYREADLSESPVAVQFLPPVYPSALKAAGIEGRVLVRYVVDAAGRVEAASISVVSSDHPAMTESVRMSLAGARFQPGRVGGIPVRTLVQQTYRFSLMSL